MAPGKPIRKANSKPPTSASTEVQPATPAVMDEVRGAVAAGFPIVKIDASAGGLEAFEQFFRHAPADSRIVGKAGEPSLILLAMENAA